MIMMAKWYPGTNVAQIFLTFVLQLRKNLNQEVETIFHVLWGVVCTVKLSYSEHGIKQKKSAIINGKSFVFTKIITEPVTNAR